MQTRRIPALAGMTGPEKQKIQKKEVNHYENRLSCFYCAKHLGLL